MPYDAHKNFAYSTVATPPSPAASGGSLVVAAGEGARFPAVPFNAVVWPAGANPLPTNAEVVRVTATAADTFTITRAQEGSSARTIGAGDQIANAITAKLLTDIESGGFGPSLLVFDSTLAVDTASIDTGAGVIPATGAVLEIHVVARTDEAGVQINIDMTVNGDTGNNYDFQQELGSNVTVSAVTQLAQARWSLSAHGSGGSADYPGAFLVTIPGYAGTTFRKVGTQQGGLPDATAANNLVVTRTLGWRSTAAINQVKIAAQGAAKLRAGSRLIIYIR